MTPRRRLWFTFVLVTKLVIQVPCYNEEGCLGETLRSLPRHLPGVDTVEVLVIDDGSTDRTAEVAREAGADYLLRFPQNQGLAKAFSAGLDAALKLGADVIVNTDADNQYPGEAIAPLIAPILAGEADMVIGDRAPHRLPRFSFTKRFLQWSGSWMVRQLSGTDVPDAASGFRAFSRRAALRLNVFTGFTYTLETIIQAGKKQIAIAHVPVTTNPEQRPSRLFSGLTHYLRRSVATLVRIYALYEPLKVFGIAGVVLIAAGGALGVRFLAYYFTGGGAGHVQSLIFGSVLVIVGFQTLLIGLVADLIGNSRLLLEDTLFRIRELELKLGEATQARALGGEQGAKQRRVEGGHG